MNLSHGESWICGESVPVEWSKRKLLGRALDSTPNPKFEKVVDE